MTGLGSGRRWNRQDTPAGLIDSHTHTWGTALRDDAFGSGWFVTTDQLAGGKSVAAMKVVSGGANGTPGALEVTGTLDVACPTVGRA